MALVDDQQLRLREEEEPSASCPSVSAFASAASRAVALVKSAAYGVAAEQAAALAYRELSEQERKQAGQAIHWALGIGAGAAYGVMRKRWPATARLKGLPFGTGFFLIVDEVLNPALGLTPGPQAFPWQTHARGLGGHLTFGLVSEVVLEGLDRVA